MLELLNVLIVKLTLVHPSTRKNRAKQANSLSEDDLEFS